MRDKGIPKKKIWGIHQHSEAGRGAGQGQTAQTIGNSVQLLNWGSEKYRDKYLELAGESTTSWRHIETSNTTHLDNQESRAPSYLCPPG